MNSAERGHTARSRPLMAFCRLFSIVALLYLCLYGLVVFSPSRKISPKPVSTGSIPVKLGEIKKNPVAYPFTVSAGLMPQVKFWKMIFTIHTTKQIVFHDDRYVNVIYEVMDLKRGEYFTQKRVRRRIRAKKKKYKRILTSLSEHWDKPEKFTREEKRIFNLFANVRECAFHKKRDAKDRVRAQVGQADSFKRGIERSGRYIDDIKQIISKYDLPEELSYLPMIESSFNDSAVSYAGASGAWQIMRRTGKRFGLKIVHPVDERNDPILATHAAAKLLKFNYGAIRSWPLAITAYNHGLWGMKKASASLESKDIAVIIEQYEGRRFRFASRNFYPEFLAALDIYKNKDKYFKDIEVEKPLVTERVAIPDYVASKALEQYCKFSRADMKRLNPALNRSVFKKGGIVPKGFLLQIRPGNKEKFIELYKSIPKSYKYAKLPVKVKHKVRRGQTLSTIAKRYNTSTRALAKYNSITNPRKLRAGQTLTIPEG